MKKSSVSRTRRFTYFQVLCYALERWRRTHNQMTHGKTDWRGSKVPHNTELRTQLMVSRNISQDLQHCSSATKSKSSCQKWVKSQKNLQDGSFHVDVQRHLMGISRQWTGMRIKRRARFCLCEKIFTKKMVILRTWIRKEVVFCSWKQTTRRMGSSRWTNDDKIFRKRTPSLPCHESIVQRNAQKAKVVENYQHTSAPMEIRLKLFFAQLFLLISSVFTEQSQICEEYKAWHVRTRRLVLAGQSDPLFVPTSSLMKTSTPSTDDLAREDLFQKYPERVERLSQQNRVI